MDGHPPICEDCGEDTAIVRWRSGDIGSDIALCIRCWCRWEMARMTRPLPGEAKDEVFVSQGVRRAPG
jgi:hypothetical protein